MTIQTKTAREFGEVVTLYRAVDNETGWGTLWHRSKEKAVGHLDRHRNGVRRTSAKAKEATESRNEAIRDAHAAGASIREIAAEAGLSSARVHQILHGR